MTFGDIVENQWASKDNPLRIGIVIKDKGKSVVLTNSKGDVWDSRKSPKLVIIGKLNLDVFKQIIGGGKR